MNNQEIRNKEKNNKAEEKDFNSIFKAAKQGDSEAQLKLGMMYKYGEGVESDFDKAYKWLCESAKQKNPSALMLLGMLYLQDEHVKRNSKRAFEYLEMAAENGKYVIQGMIASIYKLAKNYSKAFEWYKKSSNVFIFDPCGFGDLYHYGLGVEKNYEKAIELYKIAERRELPEAKYNLGVMYYNGEGVNRNKAIELWTQAAEKGNEKAEKAIEKIETSLFDDKFEEIIKIYEKEAEMENDEAMYILGFLFEERNKYEQDLEKAFEWYEKSATKGNAKAQFKLGSYYALGTLCKTGFEQSNRVVQESC